METTQPVVQWTGNMDKGGGGREGGRVEACGSTCHPWSRAGAWRSQRYVDESARR